MNLNVLLLLKISIATQLRTFMVLDVDTHLYVLNNDMLDQTVYYVLMLDPLDACMSAGEYDCLRIHDLFISCNWL